MNHPLSLPGDLQSRARAMRPVVSEFYARLHDEYANAGYSETDRALLAHHRLYYGRYLSGRHRPYFERTVIPAIALGAAYLLESGPSAPLLLDLGCGLGEQSLLFAALGAEVVGVDIRDNAVDLCRRRLAWYERVLDRPLAVRFACADFNGWGAEELARPLDGVFSMSAFSYIQPVSATVARLAELSAPRSRIFLYEENSGHLARVLSGRDGRTARPAAVSALLQQAGYQQDLLKGAAALPAPFWRMAPLRPLATGVDSLLKRALPLSFSYCLGVSRTG